MQSPPIRKLWERLVELYTEHSAPFLRDRGVPEEVTYDIMKPE